MSGANTFYFFYQQRGKEDTWNLCLAADRPRVYAQQPAFTTVLDLTSIPDDQDWSKVRYRGPFYADFDAGDDLDRVCEAFKDFLAKLDVELNFDITQARLFASGSKGFHIEIPQECFVPKVSPQGTPYLAYIYRAMAESLFVDTLDLNVYTGKRGRQWRTTNVRRDNGCYKVPITVDDALSMTPELYRDLIKEPRPEPAPTPPSVNPAFTMLYDRSKTKITDNMRSKKKRMEKANEILDPWRKANRVPPTIERIMAGESLASNAGFQAVSMQLAIYAASVGMALPEFLDRCKGLVENHVSDGVRYNTAAKRREELSRMWQYMSQNNLYDFEVGPLVRLVSQGTDTSDLGVLDSTDREDRPTKAVDDGLDETDSEDGDKPTEGVVNVDLHKRLRRGFFMNADGMFRRTQDDIDPVCRATLRNVDAMYDVEKRTFIGYEFDIVVNGKKRRREMAGADVFISSQSLKKFFGNHQISFQGSESDAASLMDIMAEKAERGGRIYAYPREGLVVLNNPEVEHPTPVLCYLTKDTFLSSVPKDDPNYFELKYRPTSATSAYDIDIHMAPKLEESMADDVALLFKFNRPKILADLLGWFVACHYRSMYLKAFNQFPLLQIWGEAGAGKSQTVLLLAHLHWYMPERISLKSAMSFTPFALDAHASSSTSAPFLIDEYKPRELRSAKGKFEKIKDLFKANYVAGDIGERGTLNKGAENTLAIIKSKATAPIAFMAEAIEMETAIIERSVIVALRKGYDEEMSAAFARLQEDPTVLSALGRQILSQGFAMDLQSFRASFKESLKVIQARVPRDADGRPKLAPRLVYNRALIHHSLHVIFRHALNTVYGDRFDADVDALLNHRADETDADSQQATMHAMSEASKVISRMALLSRNIDLPYEVKMGKDYVVGDGWVEILVEKCYDKYRLYCAAMRDTPLFDSLDAFSHALNNYSPCVDRVCADSSLRDEGSSERVVRLSLSKLGREGVQTFRT